MLAAALHSRIQPPIITKSVRFFVTTSTRMSKPAGRDGNPFVSLLVCDFDKTITSKDTIGILASLAYSKRVNQSPTSQPIPPWSFFVDAHLKDYAEHQARWCSTHGDDLTSPDHLAFLESLRAVEDASLDRVAAHGVLAGLTRDEIVACGRTVPKQARFEDVCTAFLRPHDNPTAYPKKLHVLSVNWSRDLILGAMAGVGRFDGTNVHSNDLVFGVDGVSTGQIARRVVAAKDKVEIFRRLMGEDRDEGHETDGDVRTVSVFVGDSSMDLPCLGVFNLSALSVIQVPEIVCLCR
ncbi:hypothetical protein BC936DRAFT_137394 [Jimgerdemannia flammicorona]|uniref:HAD-like domain-containing protein n=1 Tax=Jimgerdemannia flammicorona TaxID=994334 RepID=A0A433CXH5_9FUNG|nr:hypothetical protein BC936DRAFT_137394 [Jimgerdemannia flammicorona]